MSPSPSGIPPLSGLHHLRIPVTDIERSLKYYTEVLGFTHIEKFDHRLPADHNRLFAVILSHPTLGIPNGIPQIELRHAPNHASRSAGWYPFCLEVETRADVDTWVEWLDKHGVDHSPVITALQGWALFFKDPDGTHMSIYTKETHDWTADGLTKAPEWFQTGED
ncbi:Glyoxalase/Bleomycin resistance protein/Dihydroxybiphenyl dioxygenase [Thozetella sp. PMI_491]|nr:Glyoxalase/Bleomycin resistance protein/Dihydroxybiphenyl dioxygenase [Thozetella sp. PMI_491]